MDQALVKAYQTTDYVVCDRQREVSIRVGRRSREVDRLLARFGEPSAVFITAWNPFSRSLTPRQNEHRQRCLLAYLRARRAALLMGEGRGTCADWPPEASVLIFGISQGVAARIGRAWGQNAVVFVALGRPAQLLLLRVRK